MKIEHARHHWILVALILAALLFTLSEAHGQTTGSAAAFIAAREDSKPARDQGVTKPGRDQSIAKDERSAVKKGKRAAKRTITRGKHGVGEIDAAAAAGAK